ncbi:Uncharacterised protein [Vibrio cholerae]|nr:Uncharacterised protein [Vibrio cholerae]
MISLTSFLTFLRLPLGADCLPESPVCVPDSALGEPLLLLCAPLCAETVPASLG